MAALAAQLGVSGTAVRRHLGELTRAGLTRPAPGPARRGGTGRPATGWELTAEGAESLPRNYDRLALDLLDDVADSLGTEGLECVLARRASVLTEQYAMALAGAATLTDRVKTLAQLRDDEGYLATCHDADDGLRLVEHNCAVHRAASHQPALCAMELSVLRAVLGPGVEVERDQHLLSGDNCCCYRITETRSASPPGRRGI